ncbi:MAG: MerR family transcriptional regulator [Myxococcota bacterium]|nr:MerR family transcriptional regulator [Myxococcota bacterium]
MKRYRIQAVARMTGLSPALIRAWEARYRLVVPARSPSGYRLYTEEDVTVLRSARQLVAQGMAPAQVALLGRQELLRNAAGGAEAGALAHPEPPEARPPTLFAQHLGPIIDAFIAFDRPRAEALLAPALAALPPRLACEQLLLPLLQEIGDRWHRGEVSVAAEHFATALLRSRITAVLDALRPRVARHRVLCACPPGEWHEIGLLMFALDAAAQGWEPIYLGANLPLSALTDAAQRARPDLVALSLSLRQEPAALRQLLEAVRAAVPSEIPVLIGGRATAGREEMIRQAGLRLLPPSGRLDDLLQPPPQGASPEGGNVASVTSR